MTAHRNPLHKPLKMHRHLLPSRLVQGGVSSTNAQNAEKGLSRSRLLLHPLPLLRLRRLHHQNFLHGHNGDVSLFLFQDAVYTDIRLLANPLLAPTPIPGSSAGARPPPTRSGLFGERNFSAPSPIPNQVFHRPTYAPAKVISNACVSNNESLLSGIAELLDLYHILRRMYAA